MSKPELKELHDTCICVLGLGYVGLTLAVTLADAGFVVQGVEVRDDLVNGLNNGSAHFSEPGLQHRLKRAINSGMLKCFSEIPVSERKRIFIVTVGTPLSIDGVSRTDMITNVAHDVASALSDGDLVIMRSTVKLGTTRKVFKPILDDAGKSYDLAFCPERTLEGKALVELRHLPQIVGGITSQAAVRASQFFQFITPTVIRVSSVETAEMIKLVDNVSRDVMFGFANEVAAACDATGVSATEVITAGKLGYPRTNIPQPGPVGGPCLEKDPHIFAESLDEHGYRPSITLAARSLNEKQPENTIKFIKSIEEKVFSKSQERKITILGLAFKGEPETDDVRGTMALPIIQSIRSTFNNVNIIGYDPAVPKDTIASLGIGAVNSIDAAFDSASMVFIANNNSKFASMDLEALAAKMTSEGLIYDFWNLFDSREIKLPEGVHYFGLGSHVNSFKLNIKR